MTTPENETNTRTDSDDDLANAGNEGLFAQMRATFNGPMRPWIIYVWILAIVFTGLTVWSAMAFFGAQTVRDWIMYASIFLMCCLFIGIAKIWYYIEAAQYSHSREIRRLERRISRLQSDRG